MSPIKNLRKHCNTLSRRFAAAREGMVAMEFALIAPLMLTIFFGVSELSDALEASAKVTSVAGSAADLVAQEKSICDTEMNDVFAALNEIMFPYSAVGMGIRISSLIDGGNGTVKVAWSSAQNMTPRVVNSLVTGVPTGLIDTGGSIIFSEVSYTYSSATAQWFRTSFAETDHFYSHPRKVSQITRTTTTC